MDVQELAMLRDSFREVLEVECPTDRVLRHVDGDDLSASLWKTAVDLGWTAISAPESYGGLGLGFDALTLLYQELGGALAPVSILPALMATEVFDRFGNKDQQDRWLGSIASGERRAAMMLPDAAPVQVKSSAGSITLSGIARQLLGADGADLAIVLGQTAEGELIRVLVELHSDGLPVTITSTVDATRSIGELQFEELVLPANRVLKGAAMEDALRRHGAMAIAADAAGGAAKLLGMTVEYLMLREQFGRQIGSFQALKHRCADHKMALVAAGMLIEDAVARYPDPATAGFAISSAKVANCDAYSALAQDSVQLHGGIGFTWEHCCHLFLKRAQLNRTLFGTTAHHLDFLAGELAA